MQAEIGLLLTGVGTAIILVALNQVDMVEAATLNQSGQEAVGSTILSGIICWSCLDP